MYLNCSLLSITPSTLGFYIVSELFFAQYYSFNFRILHCIWVVLCSVLLLQLCNPILYLSVLCSVLLFQLCDPILYLSYSLLSITPSTLGSYIDLSCSLLCITTSTLWFYIVSELFFAQYYYSTLGFYIVFELFFAQYYNFNFRILHCIWVVLFSVLLLQL